MYEAVMTAYCLASFPLQKVHFLEQIIWTSNNFLLLSYKDFYTSAAIKASFDVPEHFDKVEKHKLHSIWSSALEPY